MPDLADIVFVDRYVYRLEVFLDRSELIWLFVTLYAKSTDKMPR